MATTQHRRAQWSELLLAASWATLIACAPLLVAGTIPLPAIPAGQPPQVAIYYDGPKTFQSEGPLDARQVLNLLGHFNLAGEIIPLDAYKPGQLSKYRAAFFVGTASGTRFPAGFLDDVRTSPKPFAWLGRHLEALVNTPDAKQKFGINYIDYRDDLEFRQVVYKGVTLSKEDPDLNLVSVTDASLVQVLATAKNEDGDAYPYALRRNRFWYFADIPFSFMEEGGRYLAFCDLLHDVLEIPHAPSSLALVRLEDVSTDIDGGDLREISDRMSRLKVPFQIAVIPVYRKPSQGIEVRLTDRPAFVDALKYAVAHGATPILHGITHQYHGTTGDDFEFWNAIENHAVAGDSADYVLTRLRMGLAEMFDAGVYPIAFETPHYAASETDYAALKTAFPLFYERTMATPDLGSIQYFPYPVVDGFGRTVLPENLGYLPEDKPDPKVLIERARSLKVVRDGVASFYFHPFLDPALLEQAVQGIAALGYQFVSARDFGGGMSFESRWIVATSTRTLRITPNNEFWRLRVFDNSGALLREQVSQGRVKGPVDVAVEVPSGGWAALECLKDAPRQVVPLGWSDRVVSWVKGLQPAVTPDVERGSLAARSVLLLWLDRATAEEANNQESYRSVFNLFGYQVTKLDLGSFSTSPLDHAAIVVVPQGVVARLNEEQRGLILQHLRDGGGLVADGRQPWLDRIGFRWKDRQIPVAKVVDVLFPEMALSWKPEERVERFDAPEGARQLMVDPQSRQDLAVDGSYGSGSYLYLSAPLDELTAEATSHYPYFAEYLEDAFPRRSSLRSANLEVYFDPGYRQGADLARLAAQWRQNGVRAVYAAAWQVYPGYEFDYEHLIQLAHQNGIAIYAWFVLPQATPKMWEQHPECRERTATGADGKVGWRLLMNLENQRCFDGAMTWMKDLLSAHEWDGVNLAELNYDADFEDYLRADRFVPMNADVRESFRAREGFDPALLFVPGSRYAREKNPQAWEQFLQFREDRVTELHRRVLSALAPMQPEHGWEIVVTMLDSLHSTYVRPALGVNSKRIAALMHDFDFTLQVEDPAEHWTGPTDRYLKFAEIYYSLVPDRRRLMFDINVMADRAVDRTHLPSQLLAGTELVRTALAAASASGRVALYSESTVASQDWELLGEALASSAKLSAEPERWAVDSPQAVRLLPSENRPYYLDGSFWPGTNGDGVLVPPGQHRLATERPWYRLMERGKMQTALVNLSADLLSAQASPTGISLRYSSPGRSAILLNQPPQQLRLDGAVVNLPVHAAAGRWWVSAPRGAHSLDVITATESGVVLNVWSWFSASAITAYGALTTALMLLIYTYIRLRRVIRRKGTAA